MTGYSKQYILGRFHEDCQSVSEAMKKQHEQCYLDMLFLNGNYSALLTGGYLDEEQVYVNINDIKPVIDSVNGFFRQIRRTVRYNAVSDEEGMRKASESMNKGRHQLRENALKEYIESDCTSWMLACGLGFIDSGISFLKDPQGTLFAECVDPKFVTYDATRTERNLINGSFINRLRPMTIRDAQKLFPDYDASAFASFNLNDPDIPDVDKSLPAYSFAQSMRRADRVSLVGINDYHFKELEPVQLYDNPAKIAIDIGREDLAGVILEQLLLVKQTMQDMVDNSDEYAEGFVVEFDPTAEVLEIEQDYAPIMNTMIREAGAYLPLSDYKPKKRHKETYYSAQVGNKEVFRSYKSVDQSAFQIKAMTGFIDPEAGTWYGMVRQMREPAMYLNKIRTDIMYILAASAKQLKVLREGAADAAEVEEVSARHGGVLELPDPEGDIRILNTGGATGYEILFDMLKDSVPKAGGLNLEWLGQSPNRQVSGALEAGRINQVTSVLASYVDSMNLYQEMDGESDLHNLKYLARVNGKFAVSVAGRDGAQEMVTLTEEITNIDYAVEMSEAPLSPAMKQIAADKLESIATNILTVTGNAEPMKVAVDELDKIGIDANRIQQFKEAISPSPTPEQQQAQAEAAQMQRAQAELTLEKGMSEIKKIAAQTQDAVASANKKKIEAQRNVIESRILANKPLSEINATA